MNFKLVSALAAIGLVSAAPAMSTTLDFENIPTQSDVNLFYSGGTTTGVPTVTGPNYGITFSGVSTVNTNDDFPLFYDVQNRLGNGILLPGSGSLLSSSAGFDSVSFLYSAVDTGTTSTVTVWSGLNGDGTALYTFNLLANSDGAAAVLSAWDALTSGTLAAIGHSISFGDAAAAAGFDNVSVSQVPVPAAAWLLISGLGGLGSMVRRRRIAVAA